MDIKFGILTVSDSCYAGNAEDKSGPTLSRLVDSQSAFKAHVVSKIVPDEMEMIEEVLREWCDRHPVDVIFTTGGTGFAFRDVTPEATKSVITRDAPGITIAMMKASLDVTPMAMLSRGVSGVRGSTLIINLPGSVKGATEMASAALPAIPHAVSLMRGDDLQVKKTHSELHTSPDYRRHKLHDSDSPIMHRSPLHETSMEWPPKPIDHTHPCHHHVPQGVHAATHPCEHSHAHEHVVEPGESVVDGSRVARRARESPYPMVQVQNAISIVMEELQGLASTKVVPISEALGHITVEPVKSIEHLPPFPASVKDGYAVLTRDGKGPRRVIGNTAAGSEGGARTLQPGQCFRVTTGAPIPPGADAVVQVEDTDLLKEADDGKTEVEIKILKAPAFNQDIRPVGSDMKKGEVVVTENTVLGAPHIGIIAGAGVTQVKVYRMPRVAVLSTGDELQDVQNDPDPLKPGHVYDSNRPMLVALFKQLGFPVTDYGIIHDEPSAVLKKLQEALTDCDVVVTTGGVSMGERDYLKQVLIKDLGATIHFGRVHMKPGKPTTFATCLYNAHKRLIFALPGNPVSAAVTCQLFTLPALRAIAGHRSSQIYLKVSARLNGRLPLDSRPEYCRAVLEWPDPPSHKLPIAYITGRQASSRLLSMQNATALLELPAASDYRRGLEQNDLVTAILINTMQ